MGRCMQLVVPCMACVYRQAMATQELEWQGMGHLRGMCSSLVSSGAAGKHKQNIRRDMLRKLSAKSLENSCGINGSEISHGTTYATYACI